MYLTIEQSNCPVSMWQKIFKKSHTFNLITRRWVIPLRVHKQYVCSMYSLCSHSQPVPAVLAVRKSFVSATAGVGVFLTPTAAFPASWHHLMVWQLCLVVNQSTDSNTNELFLSAFSKTMLHVVINVHIGILSFHSQHCLHPSLSPFQSSFTHPSNHNAHAAGHSTTFLDSMTVFLIAQGYLFLKTKSAYCHYALRQAVATGKNMQNSMSCKTGKSCSNLK